MANYKEGHMSVKCWRSNSILMIMGVVSLMMSVGCSGIGPPDRPRNVEATALSQHEVYLTWTCTDEEYYPCWFCEPDTPRVSYFVYRDDREIADVDYLEFEDDGLSPDTLYCYRVSSYWNDIIYDWLFVQESVLSGEACTWTYPLNTISGSVSLSSAGLEGVQVELIRSLGFPTVLGTTTTGSGGVFSFDGLENSQYIVSSSLDGYMFSPEQYMFNLVNENAVDINFSAFEAL